MLLLSRGRPTLLSRICLRRTYASTSTNETLKLAYELFEPDKPVASPKGPIIFLHGLFGSKRNNRTMSKVLTRALSRPVYNLDLRNHGDSPHHPEHTYVAMAADVENFIQSHSISKPTLIGHSMGAKTAMTICLRRKVPVSTLVSVDNAPVDAALLSSFPKYIKGMREVAAANITRLSDGDDILKQYEESTPIRQFLLTNLVRDKETGIQQFRIPLDILGASLDHMGDFPFTEPEQVRWEGDALFVRGTKSHYISDEVLPIVGRFFPRFKLLDIDCGHWVISERPEEFKTGVIDFLSDVD